MSPVKANRQKGAEYVLSLHIEPPKDAHPRRTSGKRTLTDDIVLRDALQKRQPSRAGFRYYFRLQTVVQEELLIHVDFLKKRAI